MQRLQIDFEAFSLRDGEKIEILETQPESGTWFAVQARTVEMPPGERNPVRTTDGAPVEQAAILGCQISNERKTWQWLQLAPLTKELIGDLLFNNGAEKDRWYFVRVSEAE